MTAPAPSPQSPKPGPSAKAVVLWSAGMLLVLGLCWFAGAVLVPTLRTRAVITRHMDLDDGSSLFLTWSLPYDEYGPFDFTAFDAVRDLGGGKQALGRLDSFARTPWPLTTARHRLRAVQIMGHCGPGAETVLLEVLRREGPELRAAAVSSLRGGSLDAERTAVVVCAALVDESAEVRKEAAIVLERGPHPQKIPTPVLVQAVAAGGSIVRIVCSPRLRGPEAGEIPEAEPALLAALGDTDHDARFNACWALGELRISSPRAVTAVAGLLGDADRGVRGNAIAALSSMGQDHVPGPPYKLSYSVRHLPRPGMAGVFGYRDGRKRRKLGHWPKVFGPGPAGKPAVPALIEALESEHEDHRCGAVAVLGGIGSDARAALPALEKLTDASNIEDRANAIWAMWMISGECPEKALESLLADTSERAQQQAINLLWLLKPEHPRLDAFATAALGSKFPRVRMKAAELHWAARSDPERLLPLLISLLAGHDPLTRADAAALLGEMHTVASEVIPHLEGLAADEDLAVRQAAAEALEKIRGGEKPE